MKPCARCRAAPRMRNNAYCAPCKRARDHRPRTVCPRCYEPRVAPGCTICWPCRRSEEAQRRLEPRPRCVRCGTLPVRGVWDGRGPAARVATPSAPDGLCVMCAPGEEPRTYGDFATAGWGRWVC